MIHFVQLSQDDGKALASIKSHLSFLEHFDPVDLVKGIGADRADLIAAVAANCIERQRSEGIRWTLNENARHATLEALQQSGVLIEHANVAACGSDLFGRLLGAALLGKPEAMPEDEHVLELMHRAVQLAADLQPENRRDNTRAALERADQARRMDFLRTKTFVGRDKELQRLLTLCERHGGGDAIALTGIGGCGKSALLSEVMSRFTKSRLFSVVWLDFDSPFLSGADPVALTRELGRQVSLSLPDADGAFRELDVALERVQSRGVAATNHYDSSANGISTAISVWHQVLAPLLVPGAKLILILDTLEEIAVQPAEVRGQLTRWIRVVERELWLGPLQIVASGRALPEGLLSERVPRLVLDELKPPDAEHLLRLRLAERGTSVDESLNPLIHAYGGNPLTIRLLADLLSRTGAESLRELLVDVHGAKAREALSQGYVYERLLKRIHGVAPEVCSLAHPGLVLRRVTPQLIREVLAPVCGLPELTLEQAETLFEQLSRQVWLVEPGAHTKEIRHRSDLRRLMLTMMNERDSVLAETIHRKAVAYYSGSKDPYLGEEEQRQYASYHSLFLGCVLPKDADEARGLAKFAGQDMMCLNIDARAHLKYQADLALDVDEMKRLSDRQQSDYAHRRNLGRERLEGGGQQASDGAPRQDRDEFTDAVELEEAFRNGNFSRCLELTSSLTKKTLVPIVQPTTALSLTQSALWYAGLSAVWGGETDRFARLLVEMTRHLGRAEMRAPFSQQRQSVSVGLAIVSLIALCTGERKSEWMVKIRSELPSSLAHVDQLRAWQLIRGGHRYPIEVDASLLRIGSRAFTRTGLNSNEKLAKSSNAKAIAELSAFDGTNASKSSRLMLSGVEKLFDAVGSIKIAEPSEAGRHLLRSCRVELYAPIRACLRSVPNSALTAFADVAATRFPVTWPSELTARQLSVAFTIDRERWLATLVVYADRFSLLTLLLRSAGTHSQIKEMHRMLKVLNERIQMALDSDV